MSTEIPVDLPLTVTLFDEPYTNLLPKFQALHPDALDIVNLDIPTAVTTALGIAPEVASLKDRIAKECPLFDTDPILNLDAYAMALSHAHTLFLMASQPSDELAPLVEEGTKLRETLLRDASALVQRQLLNGQQIKDLKGPVGYKNLAFDLQILATLFGENMTNVQGKCATQPAEVHRANEIAASVLRTVGMREQGPASIAATSDIRARAFTLFSNAYDQVMRVVSYLRWNEDDVDSIVPSLYAGRGGRKKGTELPPTVPQPAPQTPPVVATPPAANGSTADVTNGAKTGTPSAQPFLST
jgi:hypothetical protein